MPRITLVGYRGTGKSTVAALLGGLLGCGWDDADQVLEKKLGCSIATLVRARGEPAFRDEEAIVLADLLSGCTGVLSTGGGVVLRPGNRELLRRLGRPIVWLSAPADVVHRRIMADPSTPERRPSLVNAAGQHAGDLLAEVTEALAAREAFYRECADVAFDTSVDPPAAVARGIVAWLEESWPRMERADASSGRSDDPSRPASGPSAGGGA